MIFTETKLNGAFLIDLDFRVDERGGFSRTFCMKEFEAHGLKSTVAQCNLAFNYKAGTVRGLHYQVPPATETKLVRCVKGAIYDVIVDMRPDSPTYLQHFSVELSEDNHRALYVPDLFAHGYQTLTDGAEVMYQVSEFYTPGYERGLLYNDPALKIEWPLPVSLISEKDTAWAPFEAVAV
ncbi:MAG: dTDP-4-dehydrorhamnose 3,5-epimerase [Elainella sp.]